MRSNPWAVALVSAVVTAMPAGVLSARDVAPRSEVATEIQQDVPADLKPLLAPRLSELRLVVLRYNADRSTLNGNYAGGARGGRRGGGGGQPGGAPGRAGGGGAGGGGNAAVAPPVATPLDVAVSPARIARLKRFDMDWQAALAKIDASKLSPAAKTDLDGLKSAIQTNLVALDADAVSLAHATPAVPFMPALVKLIEDRIRIDPINSQKAAATLTDVTSQMAQLQTRLSAGMAGTGGDALRLNRDEAAFGAQAVLNLRSGLTEWFGFYNG